MAIKDSTVTLKGGDARVTSVTILPQPDGSCGIRVTGVTLDGTGRPVVLKDAEMRSASALSEPAVAGFLDLGLVALRTANGLEDLNLPATVELATDPVPVDLTAQAPADLKTAPSP
jgi:hypothetical protein